MLQISHLFVFFSLNNSFSCSCIFLLIWCMGEGLHLFKERGIINLHFIEEKNQFSPNFQWSNWKYLHILGVWGCRICSHMFGENNMWKCLHSWPNLQKPYWWYLQEGLLSFDIFAFFSENWQNNWKVGMAANRNRRLKTKWETSINDITGI